MAWDWSQPWRESTRRTCAPLWTCRASSSERLHGVTEQVLKMIIGRDGFGALLKSTASMAALAVLALAACGGSSEEPAGSPTAPPGMFSTLPTTESPVAGDQPPTIELNTPGPTFTPQPTPTPNPTYTPGPTFTPLPSATPEPTLAPTGTQVPSATPQPTSTPLPTYTPAPTYTPVPLPTSTPYPTATPRPTAVPTQTSTATPRPTDPPTRTPDRQYDVRVTKEGIGSARITWDSVEGATHYTIFIEDFFPGGFRCGVTSMARAVVCEELVSNVKGTTYLHESPKTEIPGHTSVYYWVAACDEHNCRLLNEEGVKFGPVPSRLG